MVTKFAIAFFSKVKCVKKDGCHQWYILNRSKRPYDIESAVVI